MKYVNSMTVDDFWMAFQAISPIENEKILTNLKTMDWPNMKDSERMKLHSALSDVVKQYQPKGKGKKISNAELARLINGR